MPSPSTIETPSGQEPAVRIGQVGERQAEQQAHQQARRAGPTTAARNSPVDSSRPRDRASGRLHRDVGQDRVADHEPGRDPAASSRRPPERRREEPAGAASRCRRARWPGSTPRPPPRSRMKRIIGGRPTRGAVPVDPPPDVPDRGQGQRSRASRERRTRRSRRATPIEAWRAASGRRPPGSPRRDDGAPEAQPRRLAQAPLEAAHRAQLAQQRDLAAAHRAGATTGGRGPDEASASASGRSSAGSSTLSAAREAG